jgi:hypothetical protein
MPPFHHNPTFVGPTPDGYYLTFYIGADDKANEIDCRTKIPNVPNQPSPKVVSNGYISMGWTKDIVNGPWGQKVVLRDNLPSDNQSSWHCSQNNPSVHILSNGTIVMVFRANSCTARSGEMLGVAFAANWTADFIQHPDPIVTPATAVSNNEDPFVWQV